MLFSVVTVALNSERTIDATLKSVAGQEFDGYEHLVVDGASRDETVNIVQDHAHERLQWVSEPDKGLYDAMNKGLRMAQGDYVIFLNSDDLFCRSDALSLVAGKIAEAGPDCLFADTEFVGLDGTTLTGRVYSARRFRPILLRFGVMPPHPSMFMRRELLLELGGFDTSFRIAADFDLIARALLRRRSSFVSIPETISHFRVGGVSTAGLKAKLTIGAELGRSLRALGQPLTGISVQMRYPLKLMQFG